MRDAVSKLMRMPQQPDQHHHAHHQLVLGIEGQAVFDLLGGGESRVALGDGCLVPSQCEHQFQGSDANRMLVVNFEPDGVVQNDLEREMLQRLFFRPLYISVDAQFCDLLKALAYELHQSGSAAHIQHHIRSLMLYSLYERVVGRRPETTSGHDRLNLTRLDEYIQTHLHEKIQVAQLADLCHMSVSRFHACFRERTRLSPYQYVMKRRVERAAWLLKSTSLPVGEIAARTGFISRSSLNVAIKREFNASPVQLRKN